MISPRIDKLLDSVDSNYASVVVAAKRARQINSYYHNLGEGTFDEFPPPMVETRSKNYLTIALEEVAAGKIDYQLPLGSGATAEGSDDGPPPARGERWHRRLQGAGAGAPGHQGRPRRPGGADARPAGASSGTASFAALTGAPVLVSEFERDAARGAFPDQAPPDHDPLSHLELVRNADAFLIAPASANTLAKLAGGLADNLLTSAALAATCPLLVAPAMNDQMCGPPRHAGQPRRCCARAA